MQILRNNSESIQIRNTVIRYPSVQNSPRKNNKNCDNRRNELAISQIRNQLIDSRVFNPRGKDCNNQRMHAHKNTVTDTITVGSIAKQQKIMSISSKCEAFPQFQKTKQFFSYKIEIREAGRRIHNKQLLIRLKQTGDVHNGSTIKRTNIISRDRARELAI